MVVQEIMTSDPVTVDATAPVAEALRILHDLDVRHVPVLDGGELVGMLSDRDVRESEVRGLEESVESGPSESPSLATPVAELMSTSLATVSPEDDVLDVIDLMLAQKVGALPVVEEHSGDLVGIVSYVDILRAARDLF